MSRRRTGASIVEQLGALASESGFGRNKIIMQHELFFSEWTIRRQILAEETAIATSKIKHRGATLDLVDNPDSFSFKPRSPASSAESSLCERQAMILMDFACGSGIFLRPGLAFVLARLRPDQNLAGCRQRKQPLHDAR
jgi:hypothetical protein